MVLFICWLETWPLFCLSAYSSFALVAMSEQQALAKLLKKQEEEPGEAMKEGESRETGKRGLPINDDGPRRKQLRHYDLLPAQTLNPMGGSGVEHVDNDTLWALMCKGNKAAEAFSEICFPEAERRSVGISRFAEVYSLAIQRFKDNPYTPVLIAEGVLPKIVAEADKVLTMLAKLNQGDLAKQQVNNIRNAVYVKPRHGTTYTQTQVDQAAGELYDWLTEESLLRSFMSYLAGAGGYFSAAAHERAMRCFVTAGRGTRQDMIEAMQARTFTSTSGSSSAGNPLGLLTPS